MKINSFNLSKIILLISLLVTSFSCNQPNNTTEEQHFLTVKSISSKEIPSGGGEIHISVGSIPAATANSDADWLTVKSSEIQGTHASFIFTAPENRQDLRKATITITAGNNSEAIEILQTGNYISMEPVNEALPAVKVARELGLGWNLGNQMDAHANNIAAETVWGNGKATQETLLKAKEAGFTSVRIPVTWLGKVGSAPDYEINREWLERVEEIVGYAEKAGLKAIINIHHDGANVDGDVYWINIREAAKSSAVNEAIKAQLKAMWTQIAEHFKDKGDFLIFEGMNEIQDGGWGHGGNTTDGGVQYAILNEWQQTFVDAVRATGGNNTNRYLGVCGYSTNPELTIKHLKLPSDSAKDRLLVSVHFYDPYEFNLEDKYSEWGHTAKKEKKADWGDEENVQKTFAALKTAFVAQGIPVYIGEFGSVHRSNSRSEQFRKYYLEYVCKAARTYGMSIFYWDNGSADAGRECSGIINHATGEYLNNGKEIVDAMVKGYFSDDPSYSLETVYNNAPQ